MRQISPFYFNCCIFKCISWSIYIFILFLMMSVLVLHSLEVNIDAVKGKLVRRWPAAGTYRVTFVVVATFTGGPITVNDLTPERVQQNSNTGQPHEDASKEKRGEKNKGLHQRFKLTLSMFGSPLYRMRVKRISKAGE